MSDFIFSLQNINTKIVNWKIIDIKLTRAAYGDFCPKSISDKSQFWVPINSKCEKIKGPGR